MSVTQKRHGQGFRLDELMEPIADRDDLITDIIDRDSLAESTSITGARSLELAVESDLVFIRPGLEGAVEALESSKAILALVPADVAESLSADYLDSHIVVVTELPRLVLAYLMSAWVDESKQWSAERVHPYARVADDACIGPGVVLGADVVIGPRSSIGPNTVINYATIGGDTHIGANNSIGGPGFSFETDEKTGRQVYFPHFGRVQIGDRVRIFANCSIARGSLRDTVIGDDAKIDNLVHISHNCDIGAGAFVIANSMLGGSTVVGPGAWIGPSTSVINQGRVGAHALTGMGAVVTKPVGDNTIVAGVPAKELRERFAPDDPRLSAFRVDEPSRPEE